MPDIVHVTYTQTGQSSKINTLGMREMQEKAYQARDAQYLLDEARFTKVTYNYYEQLNGYTYLKSLGIGYHFYQGQSVNSH